MVKAEVTTSLCRCEMWPGSLWITMPVRSQNKVQAADLTVKTSWSKKVTLTSWLLAITSKTGIWDNEVETRLFLLLPTTTNMFLSWLHTSNFGCLNLQKVLLNSFKLFKILCTLAHCHGFLIHAIRTARSLMWLVSPVLYKSKCPPWGSSINQLYYRYLLYVLLAQLRRSCMLIIWHIHSCNLRRLTWTRVVF